MMNNRYRRLDDDGHYVVGKDVHCVFNWNDHCFVMKASVLCVMYLKLINNYLDIVSFMRTDIICEEGIFTISFIWNN